VILIREVILIMKPTRLFVAIIFIFIIATSVFSVTAQQDDALFDVALNATDEICAETGRNQACYGHILVDARPQQGVTSLTFDQAGDIADVARINSLRLSGFDPDTGAWGVALMRLQANLPTARMENITLLAFGDVELENAVEPVETVPVTIQASQRVNVRTGPASVNGVLGTLAPGATVEALGQSENAEWIKIIMPDSGQPGWVSASLVASEFDLDTLDVIAAQEPLFGPMQAFFFSSGENDHSLTEIPPNGILIQTPEGVGEVNLLINEVNIQLGSTVFFEADDELTVTTLEGHADVTVDGFTETAFAGTYVTVPLGDDFTPAGRPNPPQPFDEEYVNRLPHDHLDRAVEVSPALTQEEITVLTNDAAGDDTGTDGSGDDADNGGGDGNGGSGRPDCPGNSCEAPGRSNGNGGGNGNSNGNSNGGGNGKGNGNSNG